MISAKWEGLRRNETVLLRHMSRRDKKELKEKVCNNENVYVIISHTKYAKILTGSEFYYI